jgi:hypothetical protein
MVHSRQPQVRRKLDLAVSGGQPAGHEGVEPQPPAVLTRSLHPVRGLRGCLRWDRPDGGANIVRTDGPMVAELSRGPLMCVAGSLKPFCCHGRLCLWKDKHTLRKPGPSAIGVGLLFADAGLQQPDRQAVMECEICGAAVVEQPVRIVDSRKDPDRTANKPALRCYAVAVISYRCPK